MSDQSTGLCFDDVLIKPKFSYVRTRKEVSTDIDFCGFKLQVPVISSNMDSVTSHDMATAMREHGGIGALHRFCTVEENVAMFLKSLPVSMRNFHPSPIVSIGLGKEELARAEALVSAGADLLLIDVAHGASLAMVEQVSALREKFKDNIGIIIGNFATAESINAFHYHCAHRAEAYKVGIGGGSACLTRVVTGVGVPTLSSIIDCVTAGVPIIADGGIRNSGDVAKAIAAGATAVMLGKMLAGTDESPGEVVNQERTARPKAFRLGHEELFKMYRGSASLESYKVQNKVAKWRAPEGDSFLVPYVGSVEGVLQEIEGGLRSAMSYVGAFDIADFQDNAEFVHVSTAAIKESSSHGKV